MSEQRLPQQPLATGERRPLPERNPFTARKHHQEVLRQITIPLVIGIVVVLGIALISVVGSDNQVSQIADISLIWLIAPMLLFGLIFLVINLAMVYGMYKLLQVLPGYARLGQNFFETARMQIRKISDSAVEPFLRASSAKAQWDTFWAGLRGRDASHRG